jgi:hypothetical protein
MLSMTRSLRPLVVAAAILAPFGTAWSQTCIETCSAQLHAGRAACEATYQTCLANAGGDPQAEALCAQQRVDCLTAAENAFITCASGCGSSCIQTCGFNYGMATSGCTDQYLACLNIGIPQPECAAAHELCRAGALRRYRECVLGCAVPVQVEPLDWGKMKRLYLD